MYVNAGKKTISMHTQYKEGKTTMFTISQGKFMDFWSSELGQVSLTKTQKKITSEVYILELKAKFSFLTFLHLCLVVTREGIIVAQ